MHVVIIKTRLGSSWKHSAWKTRHDAEKQRATLNFYGLQRVEIVFDHRMRRENGYYFNN